MKGPLFSIIAIGKLDNKLIYRERKIGPDVKKYTKTVNPNTPGQQTQKGFFKNAIEAWSIDGYSAADKFAWDQLAKTKKVITSGFNRFTSSKMIAEKEGYTWGKLTNCIIYDITGSGFKVDIDVSSDLSGILYLGISKYSMITEFVGVFSVNKYTFTITGLPDETKVYFYMKNTSVGESARTGIYSHYHVGGFVPVPIEVGNEAIVRSNSLGLPGYTVIDMNKAADGTGKINLVEVYTTGGMSGCKVAIFFLISGSNYSTRSYINIGNVSVGYSAFPVDLDVEIGDLIGLFYTVGNIRRDFGGVNVKYYSGDAIPCTNYTFGTGGTPSIISIHGTGNTI